MANIKTDQWADGVLRYGYDPETIIMDSSTINNSTINDRFTIGNDLPGLTIRESATDSLTVSFDDILSFANNILKDDGILQSFVTNTTQINEKASNDKWKNFMKSVNGTPATIPPNVKAFLRSTDELLIITLIDEYLEPWINKNWNFWFSHVNKEFKFHACPKHDDGDEMWRKLPYDYVNILKPYVDDPENPAFVWVRNAIIRDLIRLFPQMINTPDWKV